jgi:hypothetical protein
LMGFLKPRVHRIKQFIFGWQNIWPHGDTGSSGSAAARLPPLKLAKEGDIAPSRFIAMHGSFNELTSSDSIIFLLDFFPLYDSPLQDWNCWIPFHSNSTTALYSKHLTT